MLLLFSQGTLLFNKLWDSISVIPVLTDKTERLQRFFLTLGLPRAQATKFDILVDIPFDCEIVKADL